MNYRPKMKICGITNVEDMALVRKSGADYAGILVEVSFSERSLSLVQAQKVAAASSMPVVVLLCNPDRDLVVDVVQSIRPSAIQLLCFETPAFVSDLKMSVSCPIWKSIHLPAQDNQPGPESYVNAGIDTLLIDSVDTSEGFLRMGGTGNTVNWETAAELVKAFPLPVFLSGGIGPDNVEQALLSVKPFGVDLCSGVELTKGRKDPEKLSELMVQFKRALKHWERQG